MTANKDLLQLYKKPHKIPMTNATNMRGIFKDDICTDE
jgi:hypothetical protein